MFNNNVVVVPKKIFVTAVSAEGSTPINALDNCLVKAGLSRISLIKLTSILPHNIELLESPPKYPGGANVPAIYSYVTSSTPNEVISAGIALGFTEDVTLVAEHSEVGKDKKYIEDYVKKMVYEMASVRGLTISKLIIKSVEHKVKQIGCALAIVVQI